MPTVEVLRRVSIRDLVPDPDLSGTSRESESRLHPAAQARLKRKYRSFRSETGLSATLQTSFGAVRVEGRLDGFRIGRGGVLLYEIKPVPGRARQWLNDPSLRAARWQLQLYIDLARSALRAPWEKKPIDSGVLFLVDSSGDVAEETISAPPIGFLSQRLETFLTDRMQAARWSGMPRAEFDAFVKDDLANDRPIQQEAWSRLSDRDASTPALLALRAGAGKTRLGLRYAFKQAMQRGLPVFWVTAKARGRDEVLHEIQRYTSTGLGSRVLWKTAAHRLCDCENPAACPKRHRALEHIFLRGMSPWNRRPSWIPDDLKRYADEHDLCTAQIVRHSETLADVIIADLNYFLESSSLSERACVLVIDEVQNMPERILALSRVHLPRRELAAAIRTLSTVSRHRYREILQPEFLGETEPEISAETWSRLADELRADQSADPDSIRKIERLAHFAESYPDHYLVRWFHRSDDSGWVGSLDRADALAEDLFAQHEVVLAISATPSAATSSGSVSAGPFARLELITTGSGIRPPVAIIPLLDFSHPISLKDHQAAVRVLFQIHAGFGSTVGVFGQNRASNQILAAQLHARGQTALLDADVGEDWSGLASAQPDYLFISLGGSLSESVNPPHDLFTCGVVLAPGFRPPDIFDYLRRSKEEDNGHRSRIADSVSRVVQSAGRLQRSPQNLKPVFLLNKTFARSEFLRSLPRDWYQSRPEELLFPNLKAATIRLVGVRNAH